MKKSEWVEYYIAVNGDKPSKQELETALNKGEYRVSGEEKKVYNLLYYLIVLVVAFLISYISLNSSSIFNNFDVKENGGFEISETTTLDDDAGEVSNEDEMEENESVDVDAILDGDFTSIAGKWQNKLASPWNQIIIDDDGLIYLPEAKEGWALRDIGLTSEGALTAKIQTGTFITIMPEGVGTHGGKNSDLERARIAVGERLTRFNDPEVFYRLEN